MLRPAVIAATLLAAAPVCLPGTAAAAAPPPLAGVFPDFLPDAVDRPAFAALGNGAADRYAAAAEAVVALYDPAATAADQRAAVTELRRAAARLGDDDRPAAADLRGALVRRADVAAAVLDALAAAEDAPLAPARAGADRRLRDALKHLRAFLAEVPKGDAWLPFARADKLDRLLAGETAGAADILEELAYDLEDPSAFDEDQARFLRNPAWRRLAAAARLRLAVTNDPAASVGQRPAALDAAKVALRRFVAAFETTETAPAAAAARDLHAAAADLAAVAPNAGRGVTALLNELYDGDNFRVAIGEGFLRRFIAQTRREKGLVKDVFEGTRITGTQETDVTVDVDVRPEVGAARFDVVLAGLARTETVGRNRQATVNTSGRHRFVASKSMRYDGTRFRGGSTTVEVDPDLVNTRIQTAYDGIAGGLLDDLIQDRAFAEADRRGPAARRRARQSLERVLKPQLDRQLAEQFDVVNLRAGGLLRRRAAKLGLAPSRETIASTETEMRVFGRLSAEGELAATPAPPRPAVYDGVAAQVHQSAINNSADRLDLAGRTLTPAELADELRTFAGDLLARRIKASPDAVPEAGPDGEPLPTLIFADEDPLRVRFAAGRAVLTLRLGLIPPPDADGEPRDPVPPQLVTVPFDVTLTPAGEIAFARGEVRVRALDGAAGGFRGGAVARVLKSRLEAALPAQGSAPTAATVATDSQTRVKLRLTNLTLADGWATAVLR